VRPLRVLAAVAAGLGFALGAAGCFELRGGVVSEATPCAAAIPLGNQEAHGRGKLIRARAIKRSDAQRTLKHAPFRPSGGPPAKTPRRVCVLVYDGRFARLGGSAGGRRPYDRYLVLVLTVRHPKVLRRFTSDRFTRAIGRVS
jgi:hypothetical protein